MRTISLCVLLLCAGVLAAQASVPISGSVSGLETRGLLFSVDFGPTAQSVQLDVAIQATSGTSGLVANLIDLDAIAQSGSSGTADGGLNTGTGVINLSVTTASYSGVVDFMVGVGTDSGTGVSPYSGTLSCATLTAGAITAGPTTTLPQIFNANYFMFGRLLVGHRNASAQVAFDFTVDFGASPQIITYFLQAQGSVGGTITVEELDANGMPVSTATVTDTVGFVDETNDTSTPRSGIVRYRLTVTPMATGDFEWTLIFPSTVTVQAAGGDGGGGGNDDEGCSTSGGSSWGLLALLGMVMVARTFLSAQAASRADKNVRTTGV